RGSPVRQKPEILREFLRSLSELDASGLDLEFAFIDDNVAEESSALLEQFRAAHRGVSIERVDGAKDEYVCDEVTHRWNERLTWKVASLKDRLIGKGIAGGHDYLLLADWALLLPPPLVRHLASLGKSVVS